MTPTERLQALAESSHQFGEATVDFKRLLAVVGERFGTLIGDGCYVRLVAEDRVSLIPVMTYHADPQLCRYLREANDRLPLRIGEGIAGKVVQSGEAAFLPDVPPEVFHDRVKPDYVPVFERLGISSMIAVPLRARGATIGFVAVVRTGVRRPAYTPSDLQLARDLADRAALGIDNGRLVETLERRVDERSRTLETANRELEAFAFSVSHDLRAPLRAIEGFVRILEEDHGTQLDPEAHRLLEDVRDHADRMSRQVEELLQQSRSRIHRPIGH